MIRLLALVLLIPIFIFLLPSVSAQDGTSPGISPTPTMEPTSTNLAVEVVVETEGIGIPEDAVIETTFGDSTIYRHENLGPNHYKDFLRAHLDSGVIWIFEHEGDLGVDGHRNDESWESFPYIVDTPFTTTVSIHSSNASGTETETCNRPSGTDESQVFILNRSKPYAINLRIDYVPGGSNSQDCFTIASTIR